MRRRFLPSALLWTALVLAAACSEQLPPPKPDRPTIDERTFTQALSDLVVARVRLLPDTAGYTQRAEEILREHRVTEEEMRTFVEVHGQNDELMTRVYGRVSARLDTLYPIAPPGAVDPAPSASPGDTAPRDPASPGDTAAAAP